MNKRLARRLLIAGPAGAVSGALFAKYLSMELFFGVVVVVTLSLCIHQAFYGKETV